MNTEKYQDLSSDIFELLGSGHVNRRTNQVTEYEPAEFQAGLTLALAIYLKSQFPTELSEVYRLHCQALLLFLEELDAKSHKDDSLDISGITL